MVCLLFYVICALLPAEYRCVTTRFYKVLKQAKLISKENTKATMVSLALLLVLLAVNPVLSARIAGFHAVGGSQYINTRHTLEELASRGHEVT